MNGTGKQVLIGIHRGEIDELSRGGSTPLTAGQWKILRRFAQHNLNNGMSGLVLIQYHLQHGTAAPEDVRLLQVALDRVQQVVATIAALEEEAALAEEGR
jgi:hypothetical protein